MKITEVLTYNQYWEDSRFQLKKPLRNGSLVMMVGDNIYHQHPGDEVWRQEDSHHSNADGTPNAINMLRDTSSVNVLVSEQFYYFGRSAPDVDLAYIGYKNHIGHSKKRLSDFFVARFLQRFEAENRKSLNCLEGDPFDFLSATKRVNQASGIII